MDPTLQQGKRLLQWGVAISTLLAVAPLGYLFITNNTSINRIVPSFLILLGGIPWLTFYGSNWARVASGLGALMAAMIALPTLFLCEGLLEWALVIVLYTLLCFLIHVFHYSKKVQMYALYARLAKKLQGSPATLDKVLQNPRIQALLSEPKTGFTIAQISGGLLMAGVLWVFILMFLPILLLWIGYHTGPHRNSPLLEAHQRAVNSFVASEGFGSGRFGQRPDFWQERTINFEGTEYLVSGLQLLGLTPEFGDRYFTRPFPPKKNHLSEAEHRQLTPEEAEAVAKLRAGEPWVKLDAPPTPEDTTHQIRVIAPLVAQKSCLECHEVKEGTLLGAFGYWLFKHKVFNPADRKEATETKPDNTSPPDSKESL